MTSQGKHSKIAILGGGISGVTTGIVLQIHGMKTKIYTDRRVDKVHPSDHVRRSPNIASIHAAASVLPHSVKSNPALIDQFTKISQMVYRAQAFNANFGVRQQRHYELYESEPSLPTYARQVMGFTRLNRNGDEYLANRSIPLRKGARNLFGWYFNAYFVEVPSYMQKLYELYEASGGVVEEIPLDEPVTSLDEFDELSSKFKPDAYIISAGLNSPAIVSGEPVEEIAVVRGHMIRSEIKDVPQDQSGAYFSYNYTPSETESDPKPHRYNDYVQDDVSGGIKTVPTDVYFYPRSDCWLLGGSRQEGFVNTKSGIWRPNIDGMNRAEFESHKESDYFKVSDDWQEKVPRRIWDLNRELINDITDVDVSLFPSSSYIGYRFVTNPIKCGLETEDAWINGRPVFGNYGHGGSGYTLSWGCAWHLVEELEKQNFQSRIRVHRDLADTDNNQRQVIASITSLERIADRLKSERKKRDLSNRDY